MQVIEKPSSKPGSTRIARLQQQLREQGIDAMISMKPENSFYLSGFNPIIYSHPVVAILPAEGPPAVLVHALRDDHARTSAWVDDIRLYGAWGTKTTMGPNWIAALGEILQERGVRDGVLGIEEDYLPMTRVKQFQAAFPKARFTDVSAMIEHARYVKDPAEIAAARIAAKLADRGMDAAIATLRSGGTERDISIEAMIAMNRMWASDYPDVEVCDFGSLEGGVHNGLWCWALAGDRVAINTDNPTTRKPKQGEIVLILIWTIANGLHSENERAVAVGKIDDEKRRAYDAVLEIRRRTQDLMKPGAACKDIFLAAKQHYIDLGYAKNVPGRIGHGIGIGAHEHISVDANSDVVLEPGMILSFEPNLRIPPWGGLQHSDTVLITETGNEFLTTTERGFIQA